MPAAIYIKHIPPDTVGHTTALTVEEAQLLSKAALKKAESIERIPGLGAQTERWRRISRDLDPHSDRK